MKTKQIDTKRFTKIVDIMETRGNRKIHMMSVKRPTKKTCGCFAGELGIAMDTIGVNKRPFHFYSYSGEADRFVAYITRQRSRSPTIGIGDQLVYWARDNPELWGEIVCCMFSDPRAFGGKGNKTIESKLIIAHLRKVITNIEQNQKRGN